MSKYGRLPNLPIEETPEKVEEKIFNKPEPTPELTPPPKKELTPEEQKKQSLKDHLARCRAKSIETRKKKAEIKKAKGGIIKDSTYTTYSNGGTAKNQKKNDKKLSYTEEYNQYFGGGIPKKKTPLATEKNNIVIAMSETPSEEFQLDLSTEIEQFQEWLKNNKNGTYKEFLEDKTAFLTEEQKKDPKIIDLEPYLPNFEDVIKEYEKEQEEKKETMEDFIKRRSREMMLAEARNSGVPTLLKLKKRI